MCVCIKWNIYQQEKNEIMLFAVWMDLEIIILSEVSQTEKDKCTIDIVYYDVWNLKKMIQINLFAKQT